VTFGVQGFSDSSNGVGVQGSSKNTGVTGINQVCTTTCVPVAGTAGIFTTASGGMILKGFQAVSSTNWVQKFYVDSNGNGFFAGTLSKGCGSFKIDHPLDPSNKYLSHSFVESPDMMNVYNGNATTDRRGIAAITMPEYFEALNRDFRYQLTVIGQF